MRNDTGELENVIARIERLIAEAKAEQTILKRKEELVARAEDNLTAAKSALDAAEVLVEKITSPDSTASNVEVTMAGNALQFAQEDAAKAEEELELERNGFKLKHVPGALDEVNFHLFQLSRDLGIYTQLLQAAQAEIKAEEERAKFQESERRRIQAEKGFRAIAILREDVATAKSRAILAETDPLFRKLAATPPQPIVAAAPPKPQSAKVSETKSTSTQPRTTAQELNWYSLPPTDRPQRPSRHR